MNTMLDKNRFDIEHVLEENFEISGKAFNALMESSEKKEKTIDTIITKMYASTIKKINKDYFKIVDLTKGNITSLEGYAALKKLAMYFLTLNDENKTQLAVDYITVITESCDILENYKREFMKAYATSNNLTILLYESLVAGVVNGISNFMAYTIDYVPDSLGKYNYHFKQNINEKKLKRDIVFKNLFKIVDLQHNNKLAPFFKNALISQNTTKLKEEYMFDFLYTLAENPSVLERRNMDSFNEVLKEYNIDTSSFNEAQSSDLIKFGKEFVKNINSAKDFKDAAKDASQGNTTFKAIFNAIKAAPTWIKVPIAVVASVIFLIIAIRQLAHFYYHMRLSLAKQLSEIAQKIEDLLPDMNKDTAEKQKKKADTYRAWANKVDVDSTIANNKVNKEIEDENKEVSDDVNTSTTDEPDVIL